MSAAAPAHRSTIFLEEAAVLAHEAREGAQFVLRLGASRAAAAATPGSFVHLGCGPGLPMRRPFSILRADPAAGWIELLYKVVGVGTAELARRRPGEVLSCLGPIGNSFAPRAGRPRALMVGGGVGIPPLVFLAEALAARGGAWRPLLLMGSELPFPFDTAVSRLSVPGLPAAATVAMSHLEAIGVPSRLASLAGFAGCHRGYVTELAEAWLAAQSPAALAEVEMFSCGPEPMLKAAAALARRFGVPCQVSLEENMACAVGGCAGCTVLVRTPEGPAMKRVCVDGPVFDAASVFVD
ncbi:MAG TPA: dihydroorotate dehydrogenase electron transfer subunit [Steroidobacteraceae bacterium]|nr:dihydroorotate dehydrogenase electron transfer subunit [Steroidobacteraceae bacterium]